MLAKVFIFNVFESVENMDNFIKELIAETLILLAIDTLNDGECASRNEKVFFFNSWVF